MSGQPCSSAAAAATASASNGGGGGGGRSGWGWRERFVSPDHFVFNAFIILVLASGLIVAESFQFFFCYLVRLECVEFYKTPPAVLLYASGLLIGLYLLLPGVLCLVAARRAPNLIESAMWACIVGIVLVTLLLAAAVFEVAQYARLITRYADNRDKRSVNLLICLACITLGGVQLAFLSMETCVCRCALRCQRKGYRVTSCDAPAEDAYNQFEEDGPTSL